MIILARIERVRRPRTVGKVDLGRIERVQRPCIVGEVDLPSWERHCFLGDSTVLWEHAIVACHDTKRKTKNKNENRKKSFCRVCIFLQRFSLFLRKLAVCAFSLRGIVVVVFVFRRFSFMLNRDV